MDSILALRPFLPAKDFAISQRFYQALGFKVTYQDDTIAILKLESFSVILQSHYVKDFADNCMVQLLVHDVDDWWRRVDADDLVARFGVQAPRAPSLQSWGLQVGFLFDPSGVLWHIAEAPA